MAIDRGPPKKVSGWFETNYVVKISAFFHTAGFTSTNMSLLYGLYDSDLRAPSSHAPLT